MLLQGRKVKRKTYFQHLCTVATESPAYTAMRASGVVREHIMDFIDLLTPATADKGEAIQRDFLALGLRRSGNHAVINWILEQCEGETCFLNNLRLGENPYRYMYQALSRPPLPRDQWIKDEILKQPCFQGNEGKERLEAEWKGHHSFKNLLVHSYEDFAPSAVSRKLSPRRRERFFGNAAIQRDVLIVRD